ncbi:MAG: RHS repeat-associated core domain-containing protein, partial [Desulfobaccales bacterium]
MENAVKKSFLILLLLACTSAFGNYQSPASTSALPAWPNPSLSSFQSPAPDPAPALLLVYDESETLDLIAFQSEENAPIRLFEAVSCDASAENIFGGEKTGGWSQNRVRWDLGSFPQDAITTGFVGVREIRYWDHTRYYDPDLGRFTQPDPMGYADSMNLYQAFGQSPMNFNDPMGDRYNPKAVYDWVLARLNVAK